MTMNSLQRGSLAPLDHHLRPLMTYSSPSRRMLHSILVASDDATAGSVMRNAERISPASSGCSHLILVGLGAVALDGLHVARVRRRAVEHFGRPGHAPHDLAQRSVFEIRQAFRRARRMGQEQVPQAGGTRLDLQAPRWSGSARKHRRCGGSRPPRPRRPFRWDRCARRRTCSSRACNSRTRGLYSKSMLRSPQRMAATVVLTR